MAASLRHRGDAPVVAIVWRQPSWESCGLLRHKGAAPVTTSDAVRGCSAVRTQIRGDGLPIPQTAVGFGLGRCSPFVLHICEEESVRPHKFSLSLFCLHPLHSTLRAGARMRGRRATNSQAKSQAEDGEEKSVSIMGCAVVPL